MEDYLGDGVGVGEGRRGKDAWMRAATKTDWGGNWKDIKFLPLPYGVEEGARLHPPGLNALRCSGWGSGPWSSSLPIPRSLVHRGRQNRHRRVPRR
jgi:hypothetical protein